MKYLNILILSLVLNACNQAPVENQTKENTEQATEEASPEEVKENTPDKFYGYWKATDKSNEVLRIFLTPSFHYISDGNKEIPIVYDKKNDKFTLHQTELDVDIIYSEEPKQILWKVTKFGQTEGEVLRTYSFLKN